jgi:hypothetical protein
MRTRRRVTTMAYSLALVLAAGLALVVIGGVVAAAPTPRPWIRHRFRLQWTYWIRASPWSPGAVAPASGRLAGLVEPEHAVPRASPDQR